MIDYSSLVVGDDSACMNQYLNCRVGFIEWVMCLSIMMVFEFNLYFIDRLLLLLFVWLVGW